MSMWAMAKLAFHPGRSLKDIGLRIEELIQEFPPQACSNTLWALAVLQVWRSTPSTGVSNVSIPGCASSGPAKLQSIFSCPAPSTGCGLALIRAAQG